jgi:hypothetical protein
MSIGHIGARLIQLTALTSLFLKAQKPSVHLPIRPQLNNQTGASAPNRITTMTEYQESQARWQVAKALAEAYENGFRFSHRPL